MCYNITIPTMMVLSSKSRWPSPHFWLRKAEPDDFWSLDWRNRWCRKPQKQSIKKTLLQKETQKRRNSTKWVSKWLLSTYLYNALSSRRNVCHLSLLKAPNHLPSCHGAIDALEIRLMVSMENSTGRFPARAVVTGPNPTGFGFLQFPTSVKGRESRSRARKKMKHPKILVLSPKNSSRASCVYGNTLRLEAAIIMVLRCLLACRRQPVKTSEDVLAHQAESSRKTAGSFCWNWDLLAQFASLMAYLLVWSTKLWKKCMFTIVHLFKPPWFYVVLCEYNAFGLCLPKHWIGYTDMCRAMPVSESAGTVGGNGVGTDICNNVHQGISPN